MVALVVVVLHGFGHDVSEVLFPEEDVFAERFSGCPNEALRMSVQIWTFGRKPFALDTAGLEAVAEFLGEQRIPIVDEVLHVEQEALFNVGYRSGRPGLPRNTPRRVDEIASHLDHPGNRDVRRYAGDLDFPRGDPHHEKHLETHVANHGQNLDVEDEDRKSEVLARQEGAKPVRRSLRSHPSGSS